MTRPIRGLRKCRLPHRTLLAPPGKGFRGSAMSWFIHALSMSIHFWKAYFVQNLFESPKNPRCVISFSWSDGTRMVLDALFFCMSNGHQMDPKLNLKSCAPLTRFKSPEVGLYRENTVPPFHQTLVECS